MGYQFANGNSFDTMFFIVFFLIFGIIVVAVVAGLVGNIRQWSKNNASPRLTVPATVVAKRTDVTRRHSANHMDSTSTHYYVTFQVESGDRMELALSGSAFGMLAEGDQGMLSFQGTRYLGFVRS